MKKHLLACLVSAIVWLGNATVQVNQTDDHTWQVVWQLPAWRQSVQNGFTHLQAETMANPTEPGAPLLPYAEIKVAIPANGSVLISLDKQAGKTLQLSHRILPVPAVRSGGGPDETEFLLDEAKYAGSKSGLVETLAAQRYRNSSFVPIQLHPFAYDGKYRLTVCDRISFTVTVQGNIGQKSNLPVDELSDLLFGQMINPAQARQWQSPQRTEVKYADFSRSDWWIQIKTDRDGIFKLTPSQLSMLPLTDVDPATFRMFTTGGEVQSTSISYTGPVFREIPLYVAGEADGSFDSQDYILFYGRDRDGFEMNQAVSTGQYYNPYSQECVYWLTFGEGFSGPPLRINLESAQTAWQTAVSTTPESARLENETYQRLPIGFDWYSAKLFGTASADYQYTLNLEDVDTAQTQTLSLYLRQEYLRNGSNTEHRTRLTVNGSPLLYNGNPQEWYWVGLSPITISYTGSVFQPGNNALPFQFGIMTLTSGSAIMGR